jgi:hypothetical protein
MFFRAYWVGETVLKSWECVQVNHHKDVGRTIESWQRNGWQLHTYTCAQFRPGIEVNHYLLFVKENEK